MVRFSRRLHVARPRGGARRRREQLVGDDGADFDGAAMARRTPREDFQNGAARVRGRVRRRRIGDAAAVYVDDVDQGARRASRRWRGRIHLGPVRDGDGVRVLRRAGVFAPARHSARVDEHARRRRADRGDERGG